MSHARNKCTSAVSVLFFTVCVLLPFVVLIIAGQSINGLYDDTYYGELAPMTARLQAAASPKIIIIGNSGTAFGVDTAQMEETLRADGYNYTVCCFGLYGALGTQLMLDLAEESISDGDIILFMPEVNEQALSLYFSAKEAWYALSGHESLILRLSSELKGKLLGGYAAFVSESLQLIAANERPSASGVYARASFDERCDMKNAVREENIIDGLTDMNNRIQLDPALYDTALTAYVNDYAARIRSKGASMYYCFCPMNVASVQGDTNAFYSAAEAAFSFPPLGCIEDSLLDAGWFFDSNFHLNSAGMTVFTYRLTEQVKTWLGDTKRTELLLPQLPGASLTQAPVDGDNSDASCFLYEEDGAGWRIIGVTEEGQERRQLIVPCVWEGSPVTSISADTFSGCRRVGTIILQQNIRSLPDGLFSGCTMLKSVTLRHTAPEQVSVGYHLLDGARSVRIEVPREALSAFRNNYFWGAYAEVLTGYEK